MGSLARAMTELSVAGRERIERIRDATSLADLEALFDLDGEHEVYFAAKDEWRLLRGRELEAIVDDGGIPGTTVEVDGRPFHVHGVTHADTDAEREFLREHVIDYLDASETVYCEQGIRGMYFQDLDACEMDDYQWALRECERRGIDSNVTADRFDGVAEDVSDIASELQEAAFSLVNASGNRFGRRFERALGTVASEFFRSHADHATGSDFSSFRLRRAAAEDPSVLWKLQRYYECEFLPQPLEREWLRRHDPELELVTHARNERMADYARYHADGTAPVHLVVGAAHQPGVRYYLERHRDGERVLGELRAVLE